MRLEERAVDAGRVYSAQNPLNFQTRRKRYQAYLDHYPRGQFAAEASQALQRIEDDWDRNDFRAVRDHYQAHPADATELTTALPGLPRRPPRGPLWSLRP